MWCLSPNCERESHLSGSVRHLITSHRLILLSVILWLISKHINGPSNVKVCFYHSVNLAVLVDSHLSCCLAGGCCTLREYTQHDSSFIT